MSKTLKLVKVNQKTWIYSNYTGAIEPLTPLGFIRQVLDLLRY